MARAVNFERTQKSMKTYESLELFVNIFTRYIRLVYLSESVILYAL